MKENTKIKEDIHCSTAVDIFGVSSEEVTPGLRKAAKIINFGMIYGMSPKNIAKKLDAKSRQAKELSS